MSIDPMKWMLPKQLEALSYLSNENKMVRQVLFGGSAGGGKSRLGCEWQLMRRLKYAGTRGVIGRAQLKTLKETTLVSFFEATTRFGLTPGRDFDLNSQSNSISFYNGSEILLKDLEYYPSDPNFDTLGSLEITDFFVDEVAQVTERAVSILTSRCRYKLNDFDLVPKGLLSCNPSKTWIYNDFYLPWKNEELPTHRKFVRSLPTDNPHLPQSYLEELLRMSEYDKQRLYYGNWEFDDDASKMFFTNDLNAMFREEPSTGKKYITADIARLGADKTVVVLWDGLTVVQISTLEKKRIDEVCDFIRMLRDVHAVPLKNIICDEDGLGSGVTDTLKCTGFKNGSAATKPKDYANLKAECYFLLANYVSAGKIAVHLSGDVTELKNRIIREFETIKRANMDKDTRLSVVGKADIKAKYSFSPDHADAMMMRMYYELHPNKGNYILR